MRPQFLDLGIVKRKKKFYVVVKDACAISEVGPFDTRQRAQEILDTLAAKARLLGGQQAPIQSLPVKRKVA